MNIVKNDDPSILHLLAHKAQLDLCVNQYVDNYLFSKAKFPLSDNQSKLLLINAVKQHLISIPHDTTPEIFGNYFFQNITKQLNYNRHKCQILMKKYFNGKFLFGK